MRRAVPHRTAPRIAWVMAHVIRGADGRASPVANGAGILAGGLWTWVVRAVGSARGAEAVARVKVTIFATRAPVALDAQGSSVPLKSWRPVRREALPRCRPAHRAGPAVILRPARAMDRATDRATRRGPGPCARRPGSRGASRGASGHRTAGTRRGARTTGAAGGRTGGRAPGGPTTRS